MIDQHMVTENDVWNALRDVPDPEIPTVNLVDLGVILRVERPEPDSRASAPADETRLEPSPAPA